MSADRTEGMPSAGTPDGAGEPLDVDVSVLPDTALRGALEFAVGIAAAAQKVRPPVSFPAGLKAYLKFTRLDRTSLRAVRRVVAADETFRSRLGVVATTDLVDELGIAWLLRPEGWQQRVGELHAASLEETGRQTAEAALRKAERRRDAAEQAAARASAELIAHHDGLAREHARRQRAEEAAEAAVHQAASLRNELDELRREVDKLKRRAETESARAERAEQSLARTNEQLRSTEALRDEILATRAADRDAAIEPPTAKSPQAQVDAAQIETVQIDAVHIETPQIDAPQRATDTRVTNRVAAQALEQAAAASRELAEALSTASQALTDSGFGSARSETGSSSAASTDPLHPRAAHPLAGVRPLRPKPAARQPIAIPGGLYGDSLAAANHLLRTPRVVVVVDGYNVAKLGWPTLELLDQRELCIEMLEDLTRRVGVDIRVVFDGADVVGASARRRLIRVQFSSPGVIADDVIRADVRALPITTPVVVVTNDQAIVADVRANGANPVSSDLLLAVCGRSTSR